MSVALSAEQYAALRQAIENWRELQATLREMQALSRQLIFTTLPRYHPPQPTHQERFRPCLTAIRD